MEAILIIIREYRVREIFCVITIGADKASECIKSELEDKPYLVILTIIFDADRHVEVIQKLIRFLLKKRSGLYG